MRETTEAHELTNEERVAKIIENIIKKTKENKDIKKVYPNQSLFIGERIRMLYESFGEQGEDGSEIRIILNGANYSILATEQGEDNFIKSVELQGIHEKSMKKYTVEEVIAIMEQIIAEDYPEQGAATKQELAATLGSETE